MDNYRRIIKTMLEQICQRRAAFEEELATCPRGSLWRTDRSGDVRYYWAWREGEEYVRIGITGNIEMQQKLARKAYLSKSLKLMDRNIYQLTRALEGMEPLEIGAVVARMTKAYQDLPGEYFLEASC